MEPYDIHKRTADPPQVKTKPPGFELFDECAVGIALLPGRIHAVVMDRSGRVREERSRAITTDSDKVVTTINKLGEELVQSAEPYGAIRGIGLSISGRVTRQRTCVLEALDLDHFPLLQHITVDARLPLSIITNLEGLATYEITYGVGPRMDDFLVVQIAENVAFVEVEGGRLITDPTGKYQRVLHLPIAGSNAVCSLGHMGCASGALIPSAVLARARGARLDEGKDARPRDIEELITMARTGDFVCRRVVMEFARNLAVFLQGLSYITQKEHIVLDGSGVRILASDWAILFEDELFSFASTGVVAPAVVQRSNADSRWACGAAAHLFATVGGPRNLRVINRNGNTQGTEVVNHREHYASLVAL